MLVSTTQQGLVIAPTRSFAGLMALYENNYLRLKRLLGRNGLPQSGKLISRVLADQALHLEIRERSRYTTTVRLTYWFEQAGVCVPDPDLMLKVYHDARMVEAWGCGPYHHHHLLRELPVNEDASINGDAAPDELNRRWAMNSMLNKWLDYCYQKNHFHDYRSREAEV